MTATTIAERHWLRPRGPHAQCSWCGGTDADTLAGGLYAVQDARLGDEITEWRCGDCRTAASF